MVCTLSKYIGFLLVVLASVWVLPVFAHAEYIHSFDVTAELHVDGTTKITEEIDYRFDTPRHGIFRYIPVTHPQDPSEWYKERYIDITLDSVMLDGQAVPYTVEESRDQLYLKIGDPNLTIEGAHTYELVYSLRGAYSFIPNGGAEFFWNVTGEDWPVPIRAASVTIKDPDGIVTSARACYAGEAGASGSCARSTTTSEGIVYRHFELMPGEGMSFAVGLNRDIVERVVLERNQLFMVWIGLVVLWILSLGVFVYRYRTAYKTGNTIIAQYEPYEGLKPMYAGLLYDGTLHPQDITACIVYLAEQGFLRITATKDKVLFFFEVDDYEVTLVRSTADIESPFQVKVAELLFGSTPAVGSSVRLSDLKSNLSKQRENHRALEALRKDLRQELQADGFYKGSLPLLKLWLLMGGAVAGVILLFFFLRDMVSTNSAVFIGGVILLLVTLIVLSAANVRRTKKGYEALDHLEGFREYLSVAEKDRMTFHNAPKKSPEEFMKNLPYAIALGVEGEWAEVFKDVTIPNPDWYQGNTATFSAIGLTDSLDAFSTAFTTSSGTSASSGGGSVGGGGGGGGGGSW